MIFKQLNCEDINAIAKNQAEPKSQDKMNFDKIKTGKIIYNDLKFDK